MDFVGEVVVSLWSSDLGEQNRDVVSGGYMMYCDGALLDVVLDAVTTSRTASRRAKKIHRHQT